MKNKDSVKIITHSGSFHADDVFAVAVLVFIFESQKKGFEIIRTRDNEIISSGDCVVDVGGQYDPEKGLFDHHQMGGAGQRANGIPFASFGLVWKTFGVYITGSKLLAKLIDEKLVQPIDAMDNGIQIFENKIADRYPYTIQDIIFSYLPTWKDDENKNDERFEVAVDFAKRLLNREIRKLMDKQEGDLVVENIYNTTLDKRIIVLDKAYLWADILSQKPEPLFVIYPQRDRWHIKAVRDNPYSFLTRISFPKLWAGKRDKELAETTKIEDAFFCHAKRFMAAAGSKDSAIKLARAAIKEQ